jgi:hypothetical protein
MNKSYKAFVGHETEFDFMAASQFSLLHWLGLRANHKFLDYGCGCLRLGRLLIPYLDMGNYHGYEPNFWLIEEFTHNEPNDIFLYKPELKKYLDLTQKFDYIMLHSILTHTGVDLFEDTIKQLAAISHDQTIIISSFYVSKLLSNKQKGWRYPGCYAYTHTHIQETASFVGFFSQQINWFHPRQVWYILSKKEIAIDYQMPGKPIQNLDGVLLLNNKTPPESYTPQ